MCWQCDNPGGDYISHLIDVVEKEGWAISGVEASASVAGWLYTVGLPVRFEHPELMIADCSTDAYQVLNAIAAYVRDSGRTIVAGENILLGERVYAFGAVSRQRRRAGVIAASVEFHRVLGIAKVRALEVIRVPELEYCEHKFDAALAQLMAKP